MIPVTERNDAMKSNEHSLKELISELLKTYRLSDKLTEIKLKEIWPKVVGKVIANHTKGIYYRDKKIYISLDNAALKEELHFTREKLMKMINKQAGENIIEEIILK
jgi:predicted nucleic acid-binding Zn ribbon protein